MQTKIVERKRKRSETNGGTVETPRRTTKQDNIKNKDFLNMINIQ